MVDIACKLDAAVLEERVRALGELRAALEERCELDDGWAFRFAGDAERVRSVVGFVLAERECCPFLAFELALAPDGGPAWLTVRGPPGTKDFVAGTLFGEDGPGAPPEAPAGSASSEEPLP